MRALKPKGGIVLAEQQDEYDNLTILVHELDDGTEVMTSCWQPSQEDLALLNNGGCVYLGILGASHPPVTLAVAGEPETEE